MSGYWTTYRYSTGAGITTAAVRTTDMDRERIEERVRDCLAQQGSFTLRADRSSLVIPARQVLDVRIDPDEHHVARTTFDPPRHIPTQK